MSPRRELKLSTALIALLLILAPPASAQTKSPPDLTGFTIGGKPVTIPDYATSLTLYEKAAQSGDADAMTSAALLHMNGQGTPKNLVKAFQHFEKAARRNHTGATAYLGMAYLFGHGVNGDYDQGMQYLNQAARKNHPVAQWALGELAYSEKEFTRTVLMLERAAEGGSLDALKRLIEITEKGTDVKKDEAKLNQYYTRALQLSEGPALQGNLDALMVLGIVYSQGKGAPIDMGKAADSYAVAAELGMPDAHLLAGEGYRQANAKKRDYEKAQKHLQKALYDGDGRAAYSLAVMHLHAMGVPHDDEKAAKLFRQAIQLKENSGQSELYLANLYLHGRGVEQDFDKAAELIHDQVAKNNITAMSILASTYMYGYGVERDFGKAAACHLLGVQKENFDSLLNLGILTALGLGVDQDHAQAAQYFERAAKQEEHQSAVHLGYMHTLGLGVEKDLTKAKQHFENGARYFNYATTYTLTTEDMTTLENTTDTLSLLAKLAETGHPVADLIAADIHHCTGNTSEAMRLLEKSATEGKHDAAMDLLGLHHMAGLHLPKDPEKAKALYTKASHTARQRLEAQYDAKH